MDEIRKYKYNKSGGPSIQCPIFSLLLKNKRLDLSKKEIWFIVFNIKMIKHKNTKHVKQII